MESFEHFILAANAVMAIITSYLVDDVTTASGCILGQFTRLRTADIIKGSQILHQGYRIPSIIKCRKFRHRINS